jgi:RNA polymerase sigma-70 factor (ECF subfamily)
MHAAPYPDQPISMPAIGPSAPPAPARSDALLARLRARDEAAFRALFRRHHAPFVALAQTVVRERATAEEVVQDAWLAIVAGLDGFAGRSSLSTWMTGIVLNRARSRAVQDGRLRPFSDLAREETRGSTYDPDRFVADGHWAEPIALWDTLDPERIVGGRELWRHVAQALEALPPAQRAVVILRDLEGRDADEIATVLGLPPGHCRVLLHRARAKLRDAVDRLVSIGPDHAGVTENPPKPRNETRGRRTNRQDDASRFSLDGGPPCSPAATSPKRRPRFWKAITAFSTACACARTFSFARIAAASSRSSAAPRTSCA